jgi:hypothetical protein
LQAADNFGYVATGNIPYSFVDIAPTGVSILSGEDDSTAVLALPFAFRFYGTPYSNLCVSTNGVATFGGCSRDDVTNLDLTLQSPPGNLPLIAPLWMDLTFGVPGSGSVLYQTLGTAPSRRFVIQWHNAYALNVPGPFEFQLVLFEGSNNLLIQYRTVENTSPEVSKGAAATVGIRNTNGQSNGNRFQWSFNVPVLSNSSAIQLIPDAVPPRITGMPASPCTIWPPDKRMVRVASIAADDPESGLVPDSLSIRVTSNEPVVASDITVVGGVVSVRADRLGNGSGRVYTIVAQATDLAGNTATARATCTVPHDLGK